LAASGGPLRVALDVSSARADPTGVGTYIGELADSLLALHPQSIALVGVRSSGSLGDRARRAAAFTTHPGGLHHRWLHTRATADARRVGARIAHFTNAAAPVGPSLPYVLTIQDLSILRYPRSHPPLRVAAFPIVALSAHRARAVIVPSIATRDELVRLLRVPARRIVVVPHATAAAGSAPSGAADRLASIRSRLGLGSDAYVLATGPIEPRKNHLRLVRAFSALAAQQPSLRLVLVGDLGWRGGEIVARIQASPVADRIHATGYLDAPDLDCLMRGAAVVAYVSLYEGFGLPILEAMDRGVPVVTSATSSMPEVAGDAAILVDPLDIAAIEAGLRTALVARQQLAEAGVRRAAERRWDDVAAETWDVYDWVASRSAGSGRRRG